MYYYLNVLKIQFFQFLIFSYFVSGQGEDDMTSGESQSNIFDQICCLNKQKPSINLFVAFITIILCKGFTLCHKKFKPLLSFSAC